MLEMLRNVLDMLHSDPAYKEQMDVIYRQRVLENHVRRLSIFENLSDSEFAKLREAIELIEVPTGGIIFEQFDSSDAFYVIRGGLVKVVANAWTQARASEFSAAQWTGLAAEISDTKTSALASKVATALSSPVREAADRIVATKSTSEADQATLIAGLNELICNGELHTQFGKTTTDVAMAVDSVAITLAMNDFPDDPKKWSDLESRTFHRLLLELVFANMPRGEPGLGGHSVIWAVATTSARWESLPTNRAVRRSTPTIIPMAEPISESPIHAPERSRRGWNW